MALTVCAVVFIASSPRFILGFFCSASRSRTALETTVATTLANDSQRVAMAVFTAACSSALPTVEELTTLAAVTFDESLEAAMKAAQLLDHAGCASLQFAHFAFSLLLL